MVFVAPNLHPWNELNAHLIENFPCHVLRLRDKLGQVNIYVSAGEVHFVRNSTIVESVISFEKYQVPTKCAILGDATIISKYKLNYSPDFSR